MLGRAVHFGNIHEREPINLAVVHWAWLNRPSNTAKIWFHLLLLSLMTPPVAPTETAEKDKLSSSSVSSVSTRPAGGFHQRKTSLTTACPPTGARINSSSNTEKSSHTRLSWSPSSSHSSATQWLKRLFRLRIVRFLAWVYLILSIAFSTVHLLTSFSTDSSPVAASVTSKISTTDRDNVRD